MKIVIFGGTTEGRELSHALAAAGAEVVVCVATDYGGEEQGSRPGLRTLIGPLTAEEKRKLLSDAALCVDATHPYATHVTASVKEACEAAGVCRLRLLRPASEAEGAVLLENAAEAAAYLAARTGNILLTTGAKELQAFAALEPARLYPRVLPSQESLRACQSLGIPRRNIIAMQGPFTREMNEATIRQYGIRWLVTKDGGIPGGFPEKAQAARAAGAELIVLRRPQEDGLEYAAVLELCMTRLRRDENKEFKGETK